MLSRWCGSWRWFWCRGTNPDQDSAVFIDSQPLGIDDFFFEILHVVVVEVKLTLQSPIGHTSSTAEEVYDLVEYVVEVHYRPSSSSCNNALASLRSAFRRYNSGSYQRSAVVSASASASTSAVSPAFGCPMVPCASARSAR